MGEISGQNRESLIRNDALLLVVPLLHLLPSFVSFLLHLFHCFRHETLLLSFLCFRKRIVLFNVHRTALYTCLQCVV